MSQLARLSSIACTLALLAAFALSAVACDGDRDGDGGDGADRPAVVPADAVLVDENVEVGDPGSREGGETEHLYFSSSCTDDVLAIVSTDGTFWAELPCDRAIPQETSQRFLGKSVQIRAVPGEPAKLFVESAAAGTLEFTVGRIWRSP